MAPGLEVAVGARSRDSQSTLRYSPLPLRGGSLRLSSPPRGHPHTLSWFWARLLDSLLARVRRMPPSASAASKRREAAGVSDRASMRWRVMSHAAMPLVTVDALHRDPQLLGAGPPPLPCAAVGQHSAVRPPCCAAPSSRHAARRWARLSPMR